MAVRKGQKIKHLQDERLEHLRVRRLQRNHIELLVNKLDVRTDAV